MHDSNHGAKYPIAIIDDSRFVHRTLDSVLAELYEIDHYLTAMDALEKLPHHLPMLILLDVEMPKMDGFAAIKELKENPLTRDVPVIFLTSKVDLEFEVKAFELGAVDFIKKPFADPVLLQRIERNIIHIVQKQQLAEYNDSLSQMVKEKTAIITELQEAIVYTLADIVESRDHCSGGHVVRIRDYFQMMIDYLVKHSIYPEELALHKLEYIAAAAQLHDVGKVIIPDHILLKGGQLTEAEFNIMKQHPITGYEAILKAMELTRGQDYLSSAAEIALTHHEKWDGSGYPYNLKGLDIPLSGRIMAILDVYDALVSKRSYRKAFPHNEAIEILAKGSGSHFDPVLLDIALKNEAKLNKIHEKHLHY